MACNRLLKIHYIATHIEASSCKQYFYGRLTRMYTFNYSNYCIETHRPFRTVNSAIQNYFTVDVRNWIPEHRKLVLESSCPIPCSRTQLSRMARLTVAIVSGHRDCSTEGQPTCRYAFLSLPILASVVPSAALSLNITRSRFWPNDPEAELWIEKW